MKRVMRVITVVICAAIVATCALPMLVACNKKKDPGTPLAGEATAVDYRADGEYEVTVSCDGAAFPSDISTSNCDISYMTVKDEAGLQAAQDAYDKALNDGQEDARLDISPYMENRIVAVQSATAVDGNTLKLNFKDESASRFKPSSYVIEIRLYKKGSLNRLVSATADVNYRQYTLTPSEASVSSTATDVRLTLTLNEGAYAADIAKEDIILGGAFAGMQVQSMTANGLNLTMQLEGAIQKDESSNAYLAGVVKLDPSAVVDCKDSPEAQISIEDPALSFDASKATLKEGQAIVPVKLSGHKFAATASAGAFKFYEIKHPANLNSEEEDIGKDEALSEYVLAEGVSVTGFEKTDDASGLLSITADGASALNDVAAKVSGLQLVIAKEAIGAAEDLEVQVDLNQASFYAVFDYVDTDETNQNYIFTLQLYAHQGTFAAGLTADSVSLEEDFAAGKNLALKRLDDESAELTFELPLSSLGEEDRTIKSMSLSGAVTLAEGALISRWGGQADAATVSRLYDEASMGKGGDESVDISLLEKIVGGSAAAVIEDVKSFASNAISVGQTVYSALQFLGVVDSDSAKIDRIYNYVQTLHTDILNLSDKLDAMAKDKMKDSIATFYRNYMYMLQQYRAYAVAAVRDAVVGSLSENGNTRPGETLDKSATAETQRQWERYLQGVFQYVRKNDNEDIFANLTKYYTDLCAQLLANNGKDTVLDTYDTYTTYYYNFDTQTYASRETFRTAIQFELFQAYDILAAYNKYSTGTSRDNTIAELNKQYQNVMNYLKGKPVNRRKDGKTYMYAYGKTVKTETRIPFNGGNGISCLDLTNSSNTAEFNKRMTNNSLRNEFKAAGLSMSLPLILRFHGNSVSMHNYCLSNYSYGPKIWCYSVSLDSATLPTGNYNQETVWFDYDDSDLPSIAEMSDYTYYELEDMCDVYDVVNQYVAFVEA